MFVSIIIIIIIIITGRDSSVGIATRYGPDGPGIESRWGKIFRTRPDRPWGPPSLLYNGYRVFPGGKAAGAWRRAIPLLPLRAFVACCRVTFTFTFIIIIIINCKWVYTRGIVLQYKTAQYSNTSHKITQH
jgi:hypothetical protein